VKTLQVSERSGEYQRKITPIEKTHPLLTIDRAFNFEYHDKRYTELQRLAKGYIELYDKLEGLPEPPSQDNSTAISKEEPDPPGPSA
jgi:hypothetical protein